MHYNIKPIMIYDKNSETKNNKKKSQSLTSTKHKLLNTTSNIKNLKYYENCRDAVINGHQIQLKSSSYTLGKTIQGASNVGKYRHHQEDSYLMIEHPKNHHIKLLAVADGVGGKLGGEQASKYLLERLILFFETIPKKAFKNIHYLNEMFKEKLYKINKEILNKNLGTTTLSLAIIMRNQTLILNVGDSGIYAYSKSGLKKITRDDSIVQEFYEYGYIPNKSLMRFHKKANIITSCFGNYNLNLSSKVIPNKYKILLLATDGVTDCLSQKELKKVLQIKTKENLAEKIVNKALETNSFCEQKLLVSNYYHEIKGGKDNATAIILKKR